MAFKFLKSEKPSELIQKATPLETITESVAAFDATAESATTAKPT